ncbi:MAG: YqzL family protein [Bacillota bacterium]
MGLNAGLFWKIFEETGSVDAYLAYKQFFAFSSA